MSAPIDAWQEVLDFWFGAPGSPEFNAERSLWFTKSPATDQAIGRTFGALHARALDGQLNAWAEAPASACALIVLLDQFSRNLYRDDARAFAGDAQALALARRMVDTGADSQLPTPYHRWFVYLPFEHDESLQSQRESLRLFGLLAQREQVAGPLEWARKHAEVIERFGRYPHRNRALGRVSTPEEEAFLRLPGSSF